MDIIRELNNLPTYFYTFEKNNKFCYALLGGQSEPPITDLRSLETLTYLHEKMLSIYELKTLTDEDKKELARLSRKIHNACGGRFEGCRTLKEQEEYLRTLPEESLEEIRSQIKMYKDAREYYRAYLA
jgi:hypothetical protein